MNALDEYRDILRMIQSLEENLYLLDAKATRCTTQISDDIRCPALVHDRIAEIVVQKCEVSNRINNLLIQADIIWAELTPHMQGLNSTEYAIVNMRYRDNLPWKVISGYMGKHRDTCYNIMQSGVRKISISCGTLDTRHNI